MALFIMSCHNKDMALLDPRIQKRHWWAPKQVSEFVKQIRANSVFVAKTRKVKAVEEDPDDDKFVECALAAKARIIITGDPHLLSIKKYKNISIVTPREFIESRGRRERTADYFGKGRI